MTIYTAHTKLRQPPVLLREGFARWGLVFGPFWLLAHGAWVAGALALCADILAVTLAHGALSEVLCAAVGWLVGVFGQDMRRWALEQQGFAEVHIVAATDEDAALARLLERRPDLIDDAVAAELRA